MIRVSVHMHIRDNTPANARLNAFADGLDQLDNVRVNKMMRTQFDRDTDLVVVKGLSASMPLRMACEEGIPYIILEEPYWRPTQHFALTNSSWGYNGMCGLAWHPKSPDRPHGQVPELLPLKTEGVTIIFGQKPDDYALRPGHDHVRWVQEKLDQYKEAELRHHPLMLGNKRADEPIADALRRCYRAVTWSSTVGAEAVIAGCVSNPESPGSMAWTNVEWESREQWLHNLSWKQFAHVEFTAKQPGGIPQFIMSGYDEARARAEEGLMEHPRDKLNRGVNEKRYRAAFGL